MIDASPSQLETITRILSEHVPGCEVRAFGSRATWTAKDYSDLDLAVVGDRALGLDVLSRLKEAFEESDLPFRVDVLDWHAISSSFQKVIEKKYEVVQKGRKKSSGVVNKAWSDIKLSEIIDVKHGFAFPGKNIRENPPGDILLTPGNFAVGGGFKGDKYKYFDGQVPEEYVLHEGDLVVTMTDLSKQADTLGYPAIVPKPQNFRFLHNQRLGKVLIRDAAKADKSFISYLLRTPAYRHEVLASATGTTVKHTSPSRILAFKTSIPPLSEQRAIAHILGTLDDKIELNRRMNETLEATARALFKSWFVDFDPVRARAEGRDSGLPKSLAELFSDSFEDSDLGEIPKGWEAGAFGDVARDLRNGIQPNEIDPLTPYIALEHMPRHSIALADWEVSAGVGSNKLKFQKGDILFGKLRPYFHKVGVAPIDGVCSTDIVVMTPRADSFFGLVLGHASSEAFVDFTSAGSTGTKMPRTKWKEMARYKIASPPEAVAKAFTQLIRPMIDRIVASTHESRSISLLRDALLPGLVSGEIPIADVKKSGKVKS